MYVGALVGMSLIGHMFVHLFLRDLLKNDAEPVYKHTSKDK